MNDSIYSSTFENTSIIESSLEDIERHKWLTQNKLLLPTNIETWIRRDVRVRRAVGTTQIEGANLDEAGLRNLITTVARGPLTRDERANLNAIQAYEFIDFLSDQQDMSLSRTKGRHDAWSPGRGPIITRFTHTPSWSVA